MKRALSTLAVGSLLVFVGAACWAQAGGALVSGFGPTIDPGLARGSLLHSVSISKRGTIDVPTGLMALKMEHRFKVATVPPNVGPLALVLVVPSSCRNLSCQVEWTSAEGSPGTPQLCSADQAKALLLLLFKGRAELLKQAGGEPGLQVLSVPLLKLPPLGTEFVVRGSFEVPGLAATGHSAGSLRFVIPQILHRLESLPLEDVSCQVDVRGALTVLIPGHTGVGVTEMPGGVRQVTYHEMGIATKTITDFAIVCTPK